MDVIKFSQKTKLEAEELVKYGDILEILSKYGKVILAGSYKYDLMWGPDIDLFVLCNKPEESSYNALQEFIKQRKFQKYQFGDFLKFPLKNRPQGTIVALEHEFKGRRWELEIWFLKSLPEGKEYFDNLLSKITPGQKEDILELKYQRELRAISKHELDSATIYKGVLVEGKVNIEDYNLILHEADPSQV